MGVGIAARGAAFASESGCLVDDRGREVGIGGGPEGVRGGGGVSFETAEVVDGCGEACASLCTTGTCS